MADNKRNWYQKNCPWLALSGSFIVLCWLLSLGPVAAMEDTLADSGMLKNVSKIIDELLDGYDIRLRPQFGGT